ncbi:hypothetical protein RHSIM_Rhsim04G0140500 [Rhododendron simsii]|uniref:Protein FAR1-RELATED SEQUENCE n=1 Tax=Rhododendron simsii TaxID=118357 RepID=A0A834H187_RHOSS|nr:hypothetical protein RHSIM_Rhsim04G0140500 [Rhododendron simsii]
MALMKENRLERNEWLQQLYEIRDSWVPVYNRGTFFAGMNTTGRSEGVNSFFDAFVTSTTNLKEFVIKTKYVAKIYTRNIFNKFKDEISNAFNYKVEEMTNADGFQLFVVKSKVNELQKFTVTLDSQSYEGMCEYQNFEFIGILRRHILKVFVRLDIDAIPDHFILPRWRQKANKFRIIDSEGLVHDDGKEESEALRLSHMCQESTKLAYLAAPSYESYKIYIEVMNDLSEKLLKISSYVPPPFNVCHEKDDLHSNERTQVLLLDPNISQTKGRKKDVMGKDAIIHSGRLKSGIELALNNKKKRKCNLCKGIGHDKRTCPENPMSKANKALEAEAQSSDSDQEMTAKHLDAKGLL